MDESLIHEIAPLLDKDNLLKSVNEFHVYMRSVLSLESQFVCCPISVTVIQQHRGIINVLHGQCVHVL